jgi:hypothetical protein
LGRHDFPFHGDGSGCRGDGAARLSEFIFLVQIALLIAVGRGLGELMSGSASLR